MFGVLHDDVERSPPVRARAQQLYNVGVVHLLQQAVLTQQILQTEAALTQQILQTEAERTQRILRTEATRTQQILQTEAALTQQILQTEECTYAADPAN